MSFVIVPLLFINFLKNIFAHRLDPVAASIFFFKHTTSKYRTRANRVPGGTVFQTVAAGGGGHYSRGGTIQEGALLFQSPT